MELRIRKKGHARKRRESDDAADEGQGLLSLHHPQHGQAVRAEDGRGRAEDAERA